MLVQDNLNESDAPNNDDILDIFNTIKSKINNNTMNKIIKAIN